MRRLHHTPHHPYQGGEEPPGPVRTAPAERRPKPDSVSENIIPPSTTLSVSRRRRAARSGQDRPRGAKAEGRQREREHNSPQAQPSPYQGGEEPPGPVRTAPAERRATPDSVSANSKPRAYPTRAHFTAILRIVLVPSAGIEPFFSIYE